MSLTSLIITRVEPIAIDITLITLASRDGTALPSFEAGSHITVRTPSGANRQYSLCSNPADSSFYQIAVKREGRGRGGSLSLVDSVRQGGALLAGDVANDFPLDRESRQALFIAGGIGITPIISMIHQFEADRISDFTLYYLTRDDDNTAFKAFLAPYVEQGKVIIHHDAGSADEQYDLWPVLENPSNAHVYCCGPKALMDSVRDMTGHWPQKHIHFESFGADLKPHDGDMPFTVVVNSSGVEVQVDTGESILSVLRANGVTVASSCESGTCGSCRVGLLEGLADHRDMVLFDDEKQDNIMVCVSRAKSDRLVLDL